MTWWHALTFNKGKSKKAKQAEKRAEEDDANTQMARAALRADGQERAQYMLSLRCHDCDHHVALHAAPHADELSCTSNGCVCILQQDVVIEIVIDYTGLLRFEKDELLTWWDAWRAHDTAVRNAKIKSAAMAAAMAPKREVHPHKGHNDGVWRAVMRSHDQNTNRPDWLCRHCGNKAHDHPPLGHCRCKAGWTGREVHDDCLLDYKPGGSK